MNYSPEPWRVEQTDQHGRIIKAANDHIIYAWPNYITQATADLKGDPCDQFNLDGTPITEDQIDRIVACVNFCRQFPTEFLLQYQMVKLQEVDGLPGPSRTLADIPNFAGLVILAKEKP